MVESKGEKEVRAIRKSLGKGHKNWIMGRKTKIRLSGNGDE